MRNVGSAGVVLIVLLSSCAVPAAPTGGPPDRQPPRIESIVPDNGAVNVTTPVIRITFDEYISEPSFLQALSITPEPSERPDVKWKKNTVEISLRQSLEPNTTYIVSLDTKLRDSHGVSLTTPITQAFSTGPEINRGKISGKVVEPLRGKGVAGMQVFAYALPDSGALGDLPERPLYRTETDASGEFLFEFLSARPYFVLAVRDRNGNRKPDNLEVIAVPSSEAIPADTTGEKIANPWITNVRDTIPPEVRRVEGISPTQVSIRYSEDVVLAIPDTLTWSVSDSVQLLLFDVKHAYQLPDNLRRILLHTAPLQPGSYSLLTGVVEDSVGNRARPDRFAFSVASDLDDDDAVFLDFIPSIAPDDSKLHPSVRPGVIFSKPIDIEQLKNLVAVEDTSGNALDFSVSTADGVRQLLNVEAARNGRLFRMRVATPSAASTDSTVARLFSYLTERELGSIVGVIADVPAATSVLVEAIGSGDGRVAGSAVADASGRFAVTMLQQGGYTLRFTRDDNDNRRWDGGGVEPFVPAERIAWRSDSLRVRARWETDVDTLRIPVFNE
jgi:hypothetical protein